MLARNYKHSFRFGLATGQISVIYRDKVNKRVFCYSCGVLFGSYSFSYYRRVYNSFEKPISLTVVNVPLKS